MLFRFGTHTPPLPVTEAALRGVTYQYAGADCPALEGIDLQLARGVVVALVGANGAGKSTLADVLLGFRLPQRGSVTLGGIDLAQWQPSALRAAAGLMPQEVFLFHDSLATNIAYGRPDADADEIRRAALDAGLAPLIARLPQGLETVVGDRGQRLSGGERQRVALARLLLMGTGLLVLDEPDRKSTRLNSSHIPLSRMPSSA